MEKSRWKEIVEHLEILSQIQLTPDEKKKTADELEKILAYMEKLEMLDTEQTEPMSHVFPIKNVFREDEVQAEEAGKELPEHAPKTKENQYLVPKTL